MGRSAIVNIGGSIGMATTGTMLAQRRQAFGSLLGEHVSIFDPTTNQVLAQLKAAFLPAAAMPLRRLIKPTSR
jgi:hypothetical protein